MGGDHDLMDTDSAVPGRPTRDAGQDLDVWRRLAPSGLLLVGAGVCVVSDASSRRASGTGMRSWVAEGTVGLVLLNAGLSLFGEAVKRRALYDGRTVD